MWSEIAFSFSSGFIFSFSFIRNGGWFNTLENHLRYLVSSLWVVSYEVAWHINLKHRHWTLFHAEQYAILFKKSQNTRRYFYLHGCIIQMKKCSNVEHDQWTADLSVSQTGFALLEKVSFTCTETVFFQ